MPSSTEDLFIKTLDAKSQNIIQDERYLGMIGLGVMLYYVGIYRSGDRIEIHFLNLPGWTRTLDIVEYQRDLDRLVREYLMQKHDTLTDEEKVSFAKCLQITGSCIGHLSLYSPGRLLFGFVKLP